MLTNGREWQIFLPEGDGWVKDGDSILLETSTVRASARLLLHYLGREHYL